MAHRIFDRVRETTSTTGNTNPFALAGTIAGYRRFGDVLSIGDTTWYSCSLGSEWEVGLGTYTALNTLTRTIILASSNGGAATSFTGGSKDISIVAPATTILRTEDLIISGSVGSAVSALDLTLPSSGYNSFRLILRGFKPSTNGAYLRGRVSLDGTTFATGLGSHYWNTLFAGAGSPGSFGYDDDGDSSTLMGLSSYGYSNTVSVPGLFVGHIAPGTASRQGMIIWQTGLEASDGSVAIFSGMGYRFAVGRWLALRLFFHTGNIASGDYELYGLKV